MGIRTILKKRKKRLTKKLIKEIFFEFLLQNNLKRMRENPKKIAFWNVEMPDEHPNGVVKKISTNQLREAVEYLKNKEVKND